MAFIRLAMGGGGRIRSFLLEFVLNGLRLIELQDRSKNSSFIIFVASEGCETLRKAVSTKVESFNIPEN